MTAQPAAVQMPLPLKPPPGLCKCGTRLSVVNEDGVCDGCTGEQARLRRRAASGVRFCRVCGGEYFKRGLCHDHYKLYHRDAYQQRKAAPGQGVTA